MNNPTWQKLAISLALLISIMIIFGSVPALADPGAATQTPHTFLRAQLASGAITSRVTANGTLQLIADNQTAEVPVALTEGQPLQGEVQVPFVQGSYTVKVVASVSGTSQEVMRVTGSLMPKSPGVYEHAATENFADPAVLTFKTEGPALILDTGSIKGSAVLLLLPATTKPMSATLAIDSNGDGVVGDGDVIQVTAVSGDTMCQIETPGVDGLPLTSKIHAQITAGTATVLSIDGPFDLANGTASTEPRVEWTQDSIKSAVIIIKRVPMLTRVEIPCSRLSPPPETVQVQPQQAAQSTLSAVGDAAGVKTLLNQVQNLDAAPTTVTTPAEKGKVAEVTTSKPKTDPLKAIHDFFEQHQDILLPVGLIAGIALVAAFTVAFLSRRSRTGTS